MGILSSPAPYRPAAGSTSLPNGAGKLSDPRARPRVTREDRSRQTDGGGEERRRGLWSAILVTLGRAVLTALWRWRRELRPLWAALGLLLVPALGHAASEALAWVPLLAGAAGAVAITLMGHRPIHRWYAAGAGAAGLWAAAAWWVGLGDPVVLSAFVILLVTTLSVWVRHVHPRARVRVEGGSVWPWHWERWHFQRAARREIRRAMGSWEVASFWGRVPRSSIRAAIADIEEDHYLLTVELVPGHIALDLDNRRAASAVGAPVAHIVVVQDERDSDRPANVVLVQWFHAGLAEAAGEEVAVERPESVDLTATRRDMLRAAVDDLGAEVVSGRRLAKLSNLSHDWVARHLDELAGEVGLRRVDGGWQRLAVEEEAS